MESFHTKEPRSGLMGKLDKSMKDERQPLFPIITVSKKGGEKSNLRELRIKINLNELSSKDGVSLS
jgi:hypothetical protein